MSRRARVTFRGPGLGPTIARLQSLIGMRVDVGVFAEVGALPHTGADGLTVAGVAAVHEFGTADGRIPERSFLRATFDANNSRYAGMAKRIAARVVDGEDPEGLLTALGLTIAGDVQERIAAGIEPTLAPATVARKGSSTPLIDTGRLRQSISSRVRRYVPGAR